MIFKTPGVGFSPDNGRQVPAPLGVRDLRRLLVAAVRVPGAGCRQRDITDSRKKITMDGYLQPGDWDWPEESRLMADLSHLNTEITRYVLRHLDADAGRVAPISVEEERLFGSRIIELGERVQRHATRREADNNGQVIEGEVGESHQLDPPRKPQTDTDP